MSLQVKENGLDEKARLPIRNPVLYPIELRAPLKKSTTISRISQPSRPIPPPSAPAFIAVKKERQRQPGRI